MDNQIVDYKSTNENFVEFNETNSSEVRFRYLPPAYFKITILLIFILHFTFPIRYLISTPINYIGAIIIVLGIWIMMSSHNLFHTLGTAIRPDGFPSQLVTSGPFRISRNPMYLGFVLISLGVATLLGFLITFIPVFLLFIVLHQKFISHEENKLQEIFGKSFIKYRTSVRKWI